MSSTRFAFLSPVNEGPASYLVLGEQGEILSRGQLLPAGETVAPMKTLLIVPGTDVLVRWIELPHCTPAQAAAAAGLLLKDEIAVPRESIHLTVGDADDDGFRPVCIVDRTIMQGFVDRAAELGVVPDAIVPDHMLLRSPGDNIALTASRGPHLVVRAKRLAFSAEPELASLIVAQRPVQPITGDIEHVLATSASCASVDLMQHQFARRITGRLTWKDYRRAAALAAALLLSPVVLWTAEFTSGHFGARALTARAEIAARALPGATEAGDPVRYAQGRLAELQASDAFLATTAVLFEAVVQTNAAEIESFSYLREGVIRVTLVHAGVSEVESLARTLNQSRIILAQEPTTDTRGQPAIAITLRPRR